MDNSAFPLPAAQALTRLHVRDDLKINAERWSLAHDYHRHRQNLLYQSLWEPGIVYGLGAKAIKYPENTKSQYRDQRWVEIQPGIAIDIQGNPIVVGAGEEQDRTFRIATPVPSKGSILVRVVISYVDPSNLEITHTRDRVIESFRLDEINRPLKPHEIELFRLKITSGQAEGLEIKLPLDPDHPKANEIDLTHRKLAKARAQSDIKLGVFDKVNGVIHRGLSHLADSSSMLCPTLKCIIESIELDNDLSLDSYGSQIIYLSSQTLTESDSVKQILRKHMVQATDMRNNQKRLRGRVIIEASPQDVSNDYFKEAIAELTENASWEELSPQEPVMKQPFLFGRYPQIQGEMLKVYEIGRALLVIGDLSKSLCGDDLPRQEIREAIEFGINLIYFCHQKNSLDNLLQ